MTKHVWSAVTKLSNTNLIFGLICLMGIACQTIAQKRMKCFDHNTDKDKSRIFLDCSNMADENQKSKIVEWIKLRAFDEDGFVASRVLGIDLENNNLENIFQFPAMTSLKKLSFKYNKVSTIENNAFIMLPSLEELDLSYNLIHSDDLRLSLFRDKVFQGIFDSLNTVSALKVLKLGNNNIHSLSPFCFEYLKNLERLELNNNPLLVIDQNTEISLGHLTHLQYLDLGNTGLSKFPEGVFSRLSNVQTLFLNGNQFETVPEEIRDMPLAFLNINANPIDHLDNESFVGLNQLQQLIVSGMLKLTDVGNGTFAPLKKLVTLHLSQNPNLTNIHYDAFRDHSTGQWPLRQLHLSNTNLSTLDERLYPWTKLDLFDAKSNRWTCDCRLLWLASYINETLDKMPDMLLYYRCNEPKDLFDTYVVHLNQHIVCDDSFLVSTNNHSHGHVTRLRHFIIVIGLVIGIFVFGTLMNMGCRAVMKILKPSMHTPSPFNTGVKYRPADFEDSTDTFEVPIPDTMINGRSPIVINNTY